MKTFSTAVEHSPGVTVAFGTVTRIPMFLKNLACAGFQVVMKTCQDIS